MAALWSLVKPKRHCITVTQGPALDCVSSSSSTLKASAFCAVCFTAQRRRNVSVWSTGVRRGSWKQRHCKMWRRNSSRVLERLSDAPSSQVSLSAEPSAVLGDGEMPTLCSLFKWKDSFRRWMRYWRKLKSPLNNDLKFYIKLVCA